MLISDLVNLKLHVSDLFLFKSISSLAFDFKICFKLFAPLFELDNFFLGNVCDSLYFCHLNALRLLVLDDSLEFCFFIGIFFDNLLHVLLHLM